VASDGTKTWGVSEKHRAEPHWTRTERIKRAGADTGPFINEMVSRINRPLHHRPEAPASWRSCRRYPVSQPAARRLHLMKLKTYDFVDTGNVFIFGHSAGGWVAPMVAAEQPVIVVYGTVVRPFAEYLVENHRRHRWLRSQPDLAQLEDEQRQIAQIYHYLLVEKSSVPEVTAKHPELTAIEHFDGLRTLQHVRQLNDQNIARIWASLDVPVLALIGEFDIRTLPLDHEYIAAIVNARHPGKATWLRLPRVDHGFALHESLKDSVTHEFVGPFGDQVLEETVRWIRGIVG